MGVLTRVQNVWNAFRSYQINPPERSQTIGSPSYGVRPSRTSLGYFNERSLIGSIYTRISVDVAGIELRHIKVDEKGRYSNDMPSRLNQCFDLEANLDQGPRHFRQDIVSTMFDKGYAAIVPVDTSVNPAEDDNFEIYTMRVGYIVDWYPKHVRLSLYNEETGTRQEITIEKRHVAIVENPFYTVMNEPNSTLQRLIRKLSLLDNIDETSAGRLDLIIQLPFAVKTETQREDAKRRRENIEFQLKESQYGVAYSDVTEKITQLNRPVDNQLLKQVEYLVEQLYSQLGLTAAIMDGTADEKTMLNYINRTVEPVLDAIRDSMQRAFLGASGFARGERIRYFRNPFKLVPIEVMAEIADKFTRNEILTSNEIRDFIGVAPSNDPRADSLANPNMPPTPPDPSQPPTADPPSTPTT